MTDLALFRKKDKEYRVLAQRNQADLAAYLGLDYTELSNRLNAYKNARLTHENVRAIVRALAQWSAITTQAQARQLLDLMAVPYFDLVDWQAAPLDKLRPGPATSNRASEDLTIAGSEANNSGGKWPELNYNGLVVAQVELPPEAITRQIGLVNADLLYKVKRIDSLKTPETRETLKDFYLGQYRQQGWLDISAVAHVVSGFREVVLDLEKAGGFSLVFQKWFLVSAVTVTPAVLAWSYFPDLAPDESLINIVQLDLIHRLRFRPS